MLIHPSVPRLGSRRLAATLGVTALLAAACSGGSDTDDGGTTAGGGSSCNPDAELTLPILNQPRSLDPAQLDSGQAGYIWNNGIYDTVLWLDNDLQVQPNAAESYEYSDDLKTLTLTLREGMTFTNGNPVNAEAVRATMERTRTTAGTQQSKFANVTSIEAPDERTVVLTLSQPDAALVPALTTPAGVIADPSTFDDPNLALDPVGSGAYEMSDASVAGSTYVLEKRDDYWNADAYPFETVTVRVIADQTATSNALQAGELNVGNVEADNVARIEAAGFEVSDPIPTAVGALMLLDREGTITPALADVRVRQAINLALDREGFVQAILQGSGITTEQMVNPAGAMYVEELDGEYEYDLDAARDLLEEAGYGDGFSMTMPSTLVSQPFEPTVTQALADIGIDVTFEAQPASNISASLRSTDYPAAFWFQGLDVPELEAQALFGSTAFLNPFQVPMPEIEALLTEISAETDPDAREEMYQEIGRISVEEAFSAPILYVGALWATTDCIEYLPEGSPIPSPRRFGIVG